MKKFLNHIGHKILCFIFGHEWQLKEEDESTRIIKKCRYCNKVKVVRI